MLIGGQSKSTVFDIFNTGLKTILHDSGLPSRCTFSAPNCKIRARGSDMSNRVEQMRIQFEVKEGTTEEAIKQAIEPTRIGAPVKIENGTCTMTIPPFEIRQIPQLQPLDTVIEKFVRSSLRSQTWKLDAHEYVSSGFNINAVIEDMKNRGASDLHLRAGNRPFIRIDGDLLALDMPIISAHDMEEIMMSLGGESELELLLTEKETSFQYHAAGIGYLRCSGYIKTGAMALALRLIPEEPIPLDKLNLADAVKKACYAWRGLYLVCGITGSGKSTTLAAIIDEINKARRAHIITTEDPVEFVYTDKSSIISQRMVGRDTYSFANALRGALREDPDVILVGEMRDADTIRAALSAAETGHLVFSTLHTTTAVDTINRIITYFPQNERDLVRQELAYTLGGVICQRLLKRVGGGRIPCLEMLFGGVPIVRDAIIEGDLDKLEGIMENDSVMKTFDQYAVYLYNSGQCTREEAVTACRDAEAFERVLSGIKSAAGRLLK